MDSTPLYVPRTQPYELQDQVWQASRGRRHYAIFWEQGTGKTKLAVDTAGYLFCTGQIDAVFVLAPTDIHANWDVPGEGIQKHLPEELLKASARLTWNSGRARTKGFLERLRYLMSHKGGLRWLFMGFDAFITKHGFAAAQQFLSTYRCLWIIDEAGRIKNPQSKRTKSVNKLRDLARFRRPMTGTPIAQKPFDAYSIINWMDPTYWKQNGLGSYYVFKQYFGLWRKIRVAGGREVEVQKTDKNGLPQYQRLEDLHGYLRPVASRVLKADMVDLPPKLYTRMYYEMTPKQAEHYRRLEREFVTWYEENSAPSEDGPRVLMTSADLAIVRQLRLQQIALGYLVSDEGEFTVIDEENPALALLSQITEDLPHSAIIWGRFRKDIDLICGVLGDAAVRYDGTTDAEARIKAVQAFQAGDKPFFVATQATAGEGLTLTRAQTVVYYSNSRKLTERLQSEDRAHRIGQVNPVQYIDLIVANTITEDILEGLLHGQDVAATALGDKIRNRNRQS